MRIPRNVRDASLLHLAIVAVNSQKEEGGPRAEQNDDPCAHSINHQTAHGPICTPRIRYKCLTLPACESVKAMKTPTANRLISALKDDQKHTGRDRQRENVRRSPLSARSDLGPAMGPDVESRRSA